jgi:hypothetical protein
MKKAFALITLIFLAKGLLGASYYWVGGYGLVESDIRGHLLVQ